MSDSPTDKRLAAIATMDRKRLTQAILAAKCNFPNDLSQAYLQTLSVDELRHLYLALLRHASRAKAAR
jgi:hypothetical protein